MNRLDAIRTFAQPGYCPAKQLRIHKDRYYLVKMQNVETDPRVDYVGLGVGEYLELLPGSAARERRDARLNHCNAIAEYDGPVFAVLTTQYGNWNPERKPHYSPSKEDVEAYIKAQRDAHDKWLDDCEKELAQYEAAYAKKPEQWRAGAIENIKLTITNNRNSFRSEILEVRK